MAKKKAAGVGRVRTLTFRVTERVHLALFQIAARRTLATGQKCSASSVLESLILTAADKELPR